MLGQLGAASELLYVTLCYWSSPGRKAQPGYGPGHSGPARPDGRGHAVGDTGTATWPEELEGSRGTGILGLGCRELGLEVGLLRESFLFTAH